MSISTALQHAQQRVAAAYTAISGKGGTLPASQNLTNMATAINSIQTGVTPTGSITITTNGTHDVTNYATAVVNVQSADEIQCFCFDSTLYTSLAVGDKVALMFPSSTQQQWKQFVITSKLSGSETADCSYTAIVKSKDGAGSYGTLLVTVNTLLRTDDKGFPVDGVAYGFETSIEKGSV